jgi:hypothetical protein
MLNAISAGVRAPMASPAGARSTPGVSASEPGSRSRINRDRLALATRPT